MTQPILVLGSLGQIGRELMQRNDPRAGTPIGLDRQECDIRSRDAVSAQIQRLGPRLVINAAAYTAVDKAESERDLAFAVNCDGPRNLANACATAGIPLIHISSDYVFDGTKLAPYLETDSPAPLGVYGASKLAGEDAVRDRLERHIILRTSWVFSSHRTNFLTTILRLAAERSELRVVDDQRGGPTAAADIAEALLAIAARIDEGRTAWGTYHYCGAPAATWCAFARAIVAEATRYRGKATPVVPIGTVDYPTPARRPANSVLDCAKIRDALGISQPDWHRRLASCVAALLGRQMLD